MAKILNGISKLLHYKNKYSLIFVIGGFLLEMFSVLLITKVISISLSKTGFGEYSLFLSVFSLVSILPFFSFHTAIERLLVDKKDKKLIINSAVLLSIIFFLFYSVFTFIYAQIDDIISEKIVLLFYFFCITKIFKTTLLNIVNILKFNKAAFYLKLVDNLLQILIVFLFFWKKNLTIEYIFYSSIFSSIVVVIYALLFLNKNYKLNFVEEFNCTSSYNLVKKEIILFSIPLILWGVFIWMQNMVGRWYLNLLIDKESVANYSVVTSLAYLPVNAIISVFGGFFVPRIYGQEKLLPGYISNINGKLVLLSLPFWFIVILFSYFFGDFIITFFLSSKYSDISYSLPVLLIGNAMYCVGQLTIYEIYYYSKPQLLIFSNVLPGIISLSVGFFLVKLYGFNGAIISNLLSFGLSGLITIFITRRFSKKRIYAD